MCDFLVKLSIVPYVNVMRICEKLFFMLNWIIRSIGISTVYIQESKFYAPQMLAVYYTCFMSTHT